MFIGGENMQNNDWMNMIENMNGIRLFSRSLIPRATKEHEISSQHLDLLCHLIINNDGMTPLKLSKVMGVSKTIISRLIDGLSKSGYVIKKQDDIDAITKAIRSMYISWIDECARNLQKAIDNNPIRTVSSEYINLFLLITCPKLFLCSGIGFLFTLSSISMKLCKPLSLTSTTCRNFPD